ncbi:MAG: insulinase family protein [Oscillospiraceae bacterium]|nr:insulinase family protein [Oscillospiraceae bacterium]
MVKKITLPNGARLVCEHIPHVRSVSFGLWLGVGSRYESALENGASHMIEHLLFKGTKTRSAAQIAEEMDQLGGQMNAFTTKECTCFYGRVLDTNLRQAVDLLADMLLCSRFDDKDITAERSVIGEEIDMYFDAPDDLVSDQLVEAVFADSGLGRPILGTKETLAGLDRGRLQAFQAAHYTPERLVIALSGHFQDADLAYIQEIFAHMSPGAPTTPEPGVYQPACTITEKPIEQNHLCLMFPGLSMHSEARYAGQIFSSILGGGISSRLFQTVREEHGLCYSVYTFGMSFREQGLLGLYTALGAETEGQALGLIMEILQDIHQNGVTPGELERAREQAKSNILMSLESTSARMNSLGKNELLRGYVPTPEEIICSYDTVTAADVLAVARQVIDFERLSFSAVGQVADEGQYRRWLER